MEQTGLFIVKYQLFVDFDPAFPFLMSTLELIISLISSTRHPETYLQYYYQKLHYMALWDTMDVVAGSNVDTKARPYPGHPDLFTVMNPFIPNLV